TLADGRKMLVLDVSGTPAHGEATATYEVAVKRQNQIVVVMEVAQRPSGSPPVSDGGPPLPISVQTVKDIATDPQVGLWTSQQILDAGAKIEGFRDHLFNSHSSSGSSLHHSSGSSSSSRPHK
ncbi:MAG: hypothetical protein ACRDQA_29750, partial [Nocardioidaceae bacterium]